MMIVGYPPLIQSLRAKLAHGDLPGEAAHARMAHAVRNARPVPRGETTRDAAVLITLFEKTPGQWYIVFIRRAAAHEQDKHAGQIAFPGGKREQSDRDLMYTALREAHEETAIDLTAIDVLGQLTPLYITVSRYMVYPFVAYSRETPVLTRQEAEIAGIPELPLEAFASPASRQNTRIRLGDGIVLNHVPAFQVEGHVIWGATAMILNELLEL